MVHHLTMIHLLSLIFRPAGMYAFIGKTKCCLDIPNLGTPEPDWMANATYEGAGTVNVSCLAVCMVIAGWVSVCIAGWVSVCVLLGGRESVYC